jgi:hypothetical protein
MLLKSCRDNVKTLCLDNIWTMLKLFLHYFNILFRLKKHGLWTLKCVENILYLLDYFQSYFDINVNTLKG